MRAATLDRRVRIESRSPSQDGIGQPVDTWASVATVWANLKTNTGVGAVRSDADVSIVKASIRIRHRDDVAEGMRAVMIDTGDAYLIKSILPVGRKEALDLVCEKAK